MLGDLPGVKVDYEFKWAPAYEPRPLHRVITGADFDCMQELLALGGPDYLSGSKLTFDGVFISDDEYAQLRQAIDPRIRIVHLVRDYRQVLNSITRRVQHKLRCFDAAPYSTYYNAIRDIDHIRVQWESLPRDSKQRRLPIGQTLSRLNALVRNDIFSAKLCRMNSYMRVDYQGIKSKFSEIASFIGCQASAADISRILAAPPTVKLPSERVILNHRLVRTLAFGANLLRDGAMLCVGNRRSDAPAAAVDIDAVNDTSVDGIRVTDELTGASSAARGQWRSVSEIEALEYRPWVPFIQISAACNLKCVMCSVRRWKNKSGFIEPELYYRLLDEFREWGIRSVNIASAQGEPFLHPEAHALFEGAVARRFQVITSTNGNLLNDKDIEWLCRVGLHAIQFSFCGYDRATYERVYVGGQFDRAVVNLRTLWAALKNTSCNFLVNGVVVDESDGFALRTVEFVESLGIPHDNIRLVRPYNQSALQTNVQPSYGEAGAVCRIFADNPGVYFDGRVTACGCTDCNGEMLLGDLREQTFKEIRQSERYRQWLGLFAEGRIREIPLCSRCSVPYKMDIDLRGLKSS